MSCFCKDFNLCIKVVKWLKEKLKYFFFQDWHSFTVKSWTGSRLLPFKSFISCEEKQSTHHTVMHDFVPVFTCDNPEQSSNGIGCCLEVGVPDTNNQQSHTQLSAVAVTRIMQPPVFSSQFELHIKIYGLLYFTTCLQQSPVISSQFVWLL